MSSEKTTRPYKVFRLKRLSRRSQSYVLDDRQTELCAARGPREAARIVGRQWQQQPGCHFEYLLVVPLTFVRGTSGLMICQHDRAKVFAPPGQKVKCVVKRDKTRTATAGLRGLRRAAARA